jgi:hypothetical protein
LPHFFPVFLVFLKTLVTHSYPIPFIVAVGRILAAAAAYSVARAFHPITGGNV